MQSETRTGAQAQGKSTSADRQRTDRVSKLLRNSRQAYLRNRDKSGQEYRSLSIELATAIYRKKLIAPFMVYLALKHARPDGVFTLEEAPGIIAETLGHKDTRSASHGIQQCLRLRWMGTDGVNIYVRAFRVLEQKFRVKSRTSGILRRGDIPNIREWILSHFLGSRFRAFQHPARKKWRAIPRWVSKANARQCSISIIADELGLSRAGACKLKHRAMKLGYFRARNRTQRLEMNPAHIHIARDVLNDPGLFVRPDGVYRRLTDLFTFNLEEPGALRLLHFSKRPKKSNYDNA